MNIFFGKYRLSHIIGKGAPPKKSLIIWGTLCIFYYYLFKKNSIKTNLTDFQVKPTLQVSKRGVSVHTREREKFHKNGLSFCIAFYSPVVYGRWADLDLAPYFEVGWSSLAWWMRERTKWQWWRKKKNCKPIPMQPIFGIGFKLGTLGDNNDNNGGASRQSLPFGTALKRQKKKKA
jgi:hypothetical protein